ncbi:MAG: hypothetical protein PF572_00485 [Patescibacteria group bacterium]|jgi:hypothetical protein|nr:hypothetical protein [Patescibacteria group bacterium]
MFNNINSMFKKIGDKFPGHHLVFFSSVLTILFLIVMFNPVYSSIGDTNVYATGLKITINSPVNVMSDSPVSSLTASSSILTSSSSIEISGNVFDTTGSVNWTRWTNDNWVSETNISPDFDDWTVTVPLVDGLNTLEFRTRKGGIQVYLKIYVTKIPSDSEDLYGYVWADTIGWISFSSLNCDPDSDLQSEGIGNCPPLNSPIPDYGVSVSSTTGNMSGFAWSPNVGWIDFATTSPTAPSYDFNTNCLDSCEVGDGCSACYAPDSGNPGTGDLYGWAKIISLGDDGWISLSSSTAPLYGITYDVATNQFSGYAWNGSSVDAGIGWLSFSSTNCDTDDDGFSDAGGDCPAFGATITRYGPMAQLNMPPTASFVFLTSITELPCDSGALDLEGPCVSNCELEPIVDWNYDDPEGFLQHSYRFTIDEVGGSNDFDTGEVISSDTQIQPHLLPITIEYGTEYDITIETWDNYGLSSVVDTYNFTTRKHQYPNPYFYWFIEDGSADEEIMFTASSTYYYDSTDSSADNPGSPGECLIPVCTKVWSSDDTTDFGDVNNATTTAVFPTDGDSQHMNLVVTDGDEYSCSTSTNAVDINKKLPSWIEVR